MDELIHLLKNKSTLITSAVAILIPLYTYKTLLSTYRRLRNKYEQDVLFLRRHNCVVIYSENKGMSGWPPHLETISLNLKKENCLNVFYEPILYFINNANKSLDVAFMLININSIYQALIKAHKRGVQIRILLNFDSNNSKLSAVRSLLKEGIQILTYISPKPRMSSIMHYKFMIKDYSKSSGFVFTGSLNLSESALLNNFEDIVFTSNRYVTKSFYENFEECWNYIQIDNENLINKTILLDANLI